MPDMSHIRDGTSDALASSLVRLLRDHIYDEVTVSMLTREAGMNRTSFYRRFGSVDEVVSYIYEGAMRPISRAASEMDGWETVKAFFV